MALLIVLILMSSPMAVYALDQSHTPLDTFQNPADTMFYGVCWNTNNYSYAIAVGENTSSYHAVIYRYSVDGWKKIYESTYQGDYNDVAYDEGQGMFYVVGYDSDSSTSAALSIDGENFLVSSLGTPPGDELRGVTLDTVTTHDQTLVIAAGYLYDNGNPEGIIAKYDTSSNLWNYVYADTNTLFDDITFNGGDENPLFIAVGWNETSSRGFACAYNYSSLWTIDLPDNCGELNSVSWKGSAPDGYALAVGISSEGSTGMAVRIDVNFPGLYISYADMSTGALKEFFGSNDHRIYTPVPGAHANFTDVAVDSRGFPHIAYYKNDTGDLMYARYDGRKWWISPVDTDGDVGMYCSIAIDKDNHPHIAYFDRTNGYLKHAWLENGRWNTEVVDSNPSSGVGASMTTGSDGIGLYISYGSSDGLRYATDSSGSWQIQNIDNNNAFRTSIAVDSNDSVHIEYLSKSGSTGNLRYASNTDGSWSTKLVVSNIALYNGLKTSISLNSTDAPHLFFTTGGTYLWQYRYENGNFYSSTLYLPSGQWAEDISSVYSQKDDVMRVIYREFNSSSGLSSLVYSEFYDETDSWGNRHVVDSSGGIWPSMDETERYYIWSTAITPVDTGSQEPILNAVAWSPDGKRATIVGDSDSIYLYYDGGDHISLWNSGGTDAFYGVTMKPPHSPGNALVVGASQSSLVSYQVADTSTTISASVHTPHINSLDFLDQYGTSRLNQQVDVGALYTFRMNTSYAEGWDKIGIDIEAWYDNYDGTKEYGYNDTAGKNLNFKIHFQPDPVDPYNRSGNCTLLWPNTEEVVLDHWDISVDDNPSAGTIGINDGQDYYHISIVLRFGEQMAYAPGDGSWDPASDQTDPGSAFNDPYSWNFNMTIYDRNSPTSKESKYDEFGIFAYTEVSAAGSPGGSGVPGSMVPLSPASHIYVRSNVPYNLTVNITDLKNATGQSYIPREYVEVLNSDQNGANTTSNTDISSWTPFASGTDSLFVWGTSAGGHMYPLTDGTYTAGNTPGYSTSPVYSTVMWRIHLPAGLREDTFTATITYSIDYEV